MAFLTCTDATRNIDRFYIVEVTLTLFDDWAGAARMGGAAPRALCG